MDTGSWIVVSVAVVLAGSVFGVHLTRSAWDGAPARWGAPALLAVHCGVAAVAGAIGVAAAARSWQVLGEPADGRPPLIDVSRIDGDGKMYALLVLGLVAATLLAVVALGLATRFAADDDPVERMVACAVLGLEILIGSIGAFQVLGGSRGALAIAATLQLPLAMAALMSCWPPVDAEDLLDAAR